ncbi:MAG TPA: molybdopterin converting factor subunit 1 [Vicinamibacteria bacterium]|nr:molybdopterin converting factor subunit 1 [Vicinamibacteria bacterium]
MRVRVRLFASLREAVGRSELELEVGGDATPEEVFRALSRTHPALTKRRASLSAAVNRRYVGFDEPLREGDEVVFVPPVSGG